MGLMSPLDDGRERADSVARQPSHGDLDCPPANTQHSASSPPRSPPLPGPELDESYPAVSSLEASGGNVAQQPLDPAAFATAEQGGIGHNTSTADRRLSSDQYSISNRDSVEMTAISEEEIALIRDDEEAGLTAKERRHRARQRRLQRRELDSRFDSNIPDEGKRIADRNVVKKLSINVVLILLWYFFSLSISIYNKWMFSSDHLNFEFPLFTTSIHMAVQFSLASTIIYFFPSLRPGQSSQPNQDGRPVKLRDLISKQFYFTRLVPCGTATSLDIGLGNMSMRFITLTFVTMCKSSALAFVLLFAFLFGLETPSLKLIIIIGTMTVGVVMMVAGETAFNAIGFTLIIASAFFSGFRWGLTQILLLRHPATSNPFATLFLLTPIMFVSLVLISSVVEGPISIAHGLSALVQATGVFSSIGLLIFPGCLAFCMIASEFALLKRSSVVTLSICGIFKEVVTITAAGAIFKDALTAINIAGLAVTIASIASYNYLKIARMRHEARLDLMEERADDTESDDDDESLLAQSSINGHLAANSSNIVRSVSPGLHTRTTPIAKANPNRVTTLSGSPPRLGAAAPASP